MPCTVALSAGPRGPWGQHSGANQLRQSWVAQGYHWRPWYSGSSEPSCKGAQKHSHQPSHEGLPAVSKLKLPLCRLSHCFWVSFCSFQALVVAHDDIAAKNYEELPDALPVFYSPPTAFAAPPTDAIRMVGIRKNPDEPLVGHSLQFCLTSLHLMLLVSDLFLPQPVKMK